MFDHGGEPKQNLHDLAANILPNHFAFKTIWNICDMQKLKSVSSNDGARTALSADCLYMYILYLFDAWETYVIELSWGCDIILKRGFSVILTVYC